MRCVFSKTVINGEKVEGKWVDIDKQFEIKKDFTTFDDEWMSKHVQRGQYILQISKCNDLKCCSIRRSSINLYLPGQFLSPLKYMKFDFLFFVCKFL